MVDVSAVLQASEIAERHQLSLHVAQGGVSNKSGRWRLGPGAADSGPDEGGMPAIIRRPG